PYLGTQGFFPGKGTPDRGPGHKKTLFGRKTIDIIGFSMFCKILLQSVIGAQNSPQVTNIFSQGKFTVDEYTIQDFYFIVLIGKCGAAFRKFGKVVLGPPVYHISIGIEPGSTIIEGMRYLVPDYGADPPVINGLIGQIIIKWRLQDGCRKNDLVI